MHDWPPLPLPAVSRKDFEAAGAELARCLLALQHTLAEQARRSVIVVFAGVDGAGKHESARLLSEWLDARYLRTLAYAEPTTDEAGRPPLWRFWRDLPAHGRISLVLSGWYSQPLQRQAQGRSNAEQFAAELAEIAAFERDLVADGTVLLKIWLHLSAADQHQRLLDLLADPDDAWQVEPRDWQNLHLTDDYLAATQIILRQNNDPPWQVFDGQAERPRGLAVARALCTALEAAVQEAPATAVSPPALPRRRRLARLVQPTGEPPDYKARKKAATAQIQRGQQRLRARGEALALVIECPDAAGKGGAIRRLAQTLDLRWCDIHPISAPSDAERARHYLWRFWMRLPSRGEISIFDRSWYGRVLVERVEGFTTRWPEAYAEINHFEACLARHGVHLGKFWLQISPEEQAARFAAREADPLKAWKLTPDDWRNRERWADYQRAAEIMLAACAQPPWQVVAANDKRHARLAVLEAVAAALLARSE